MIYRSLAEELSVWGSPLQTSGILAAGVSARSLTILSGRITEVIKCFQSPSTIQLAKDINMKKGMLSMK